MQKIPLEKHLDELRARLIWVFAAFFFFSVFGMAFSGEIIGSIISDIVPSQDAAIASLHPAEFLLSQLKIGLILGLMLASPFIIYHAIMFIRPALKRYEVDAIRMIFPAVFLLFIIGCAFGYFIFLRIVLYFLAGTAAGTALNVWGISRLIGFVSLFTFGFGFVFELPLVVILLSRLNIISRKTLKAKRPHIYVSIFIISALLTPGDIVTQLLLAIPLILLFEASLLIS